MSKYLKIIVKFSENDAIDAALLRYVISYGINLVFHIFLHVAKVNGGQMLPL